MAVKKTKALDIDMIKFADMIKALAHPSRMSIMCLLCHNKKLTVKCIYKELNLQQPVISRHLGILRNAGLVKRIAEGAQTFYEVSNNDKYVKHISKCFMLY